MEEYELQGRTGSYINLDTTCNRFAPNKGFG